MIRQIHLVSLDREASRRKTRRMRFLEALEARVSFDRLADAVSPAYASRFGARRIYTPDRMLRMYTVRVLYGLSDEGTEDICSDSAAMQDFLLLDEPDDRLPDASTLAAFRRLLDEYGLRETVLDALAEGVGQLSCEKEWKTTVPLLTERIVCERTLWGDGKKKPSAYI